MADTVEITPGTGAVIGTDEVTIGGTPQQIQRVKLVDGTDGGTDLLPGSAARGLAVEPRPNTLVTSLTASSGLTTATTAYTAGDVLGAGWSFANAVRSSGGTGRVVGAVLLDKADVVQAVDLYLFSGSVTFGTDNAAPSLSDTDAEKLQAGVIGVSMADLGGVRYGAAGGLSVPFTCDATTLYAYAITRVAHSFFGAATDLPLRLFIERD